MPYVKLVGGAVILWIAVKLLTQGAEEESHAHKEAAGLWQALWIIVVADISMGIDNMLAVGAASHGSLFLLLFGLGLSIPFVVFMSNMLSKLMDRYPIILWVGAGILGKVGGQMMITDPWIQGLFPAPAWMVHVIEAIGIAFVCGLAKFLLWKRQSAGSLLAAPAASQARGPLRAVLAVRGHRRPRCRARGAAAAPPCLAAWRACVTAIR